MLQEVVGRALLFVIPLCARRGIKLLHGEEEQSRDILLRFEVGGRGKLILDKVPPKHRNTLILVAIVVMIMGARTA